MKLRTGILLLGMLSGRVWAQNPDVIQDTRSTLQNVQKKQVIDQNQVLSAAGQSTSSNPAPARSTTAAATTTSQPATKTNSTTASKASAKAGKAKTKTTATAAETPAKPAAPVAVEDKQNPTTEPKKESKSYAANGRRDPFVSPVISRSMVASGCSSGKRCLAIDQIALTGVVKSDSGMIAVVVNSVNKAYFLRENDPVFNGYVVKITGDSIIFQETVQDNLGKSVTREVTKKITTPAV
jgi:Tfp pilus assembly protein PilP